MQFSDETLTELAKNLTILWSYITEDKTKVICCSPERCLFIHYKKPNARLIKTVNDLMRTFIHRPERHMPFMMSKDRADLLLNRLLASINKHEEYRIYRDADRHVVRTYFELEPLLERLNKKILPGTFGTIISVEQPQHDHDMICFKLRPDIDSYSRLSDRQRVQYAVDLIQCECHNCEKQHVIRVCETCKIAKFCSRGCERNKQKSHRGAECEDFAKKYQALSA